MAIRVAVLAIVVAVPALAADEPPEGPFEWNCKAQGYFEMKVAPDGGYRPVVDATVAGPIHITIQRRSEEGINVYNNARMYSIGDLDMRYTVSLTGLAGEHPFTTDGPLDFYDSGVRFNFPFITDPIARRKGLKGVEAIYWKTGHWPQVLSIHPSDKDWVFSVYSGDLTTDLEARHLNIETPLDKRGMHWDAEAKVNLLAGPCVRKR